MPHNGIDCNRKRKKQTKLARIVNYSYFFLSNELNFTYSEYVSFHESKISNFIINYILFSSYSREFRNKLTEKKIWNRNAKKKENFSWWEIWTRARWLKKMVFVRLCYGDFIVWLICYLSGHYIATIHLHCIERKK